MNPDFRFIRTHELKLTQSEVAEKIGCSISYISKIEHNATPITAEMRPLLEKFYGVPVEQTFINIKMDKYPPYRRAKELISKVSALEAENKHLERLLFSNLKNYARDLKFLEQHNININAIFIATLIPNYHNRTFNELNKITEMLLNDKDLNNDIDNLSALIAEKVREYYETNKDSANKNVR
jgi:transcriptional regulator with XRE-family HTH domain